MILCLLIIKAGTIAQKPDSLKAHHFITLQLGINQVKDENLHPKTSSGIGTQITYGFEKQRKKLSQFEFMLGYSRLKTELEDLSKTVNLRLRLEYSLNYKLVDRPKFIYQLGPDVVLDYSASFFPNWDDSHLYWADYLSFGVKNIVSVPLTEHREWRTTVSFPLFSLFSRPELYRLYKIDDTDAGGIISNLNSDITAAHLTNVFRVRLQTEYLFLAFKQGRQALSYSFEWIGVQDDDSHPFHKLSHMVGIKFFL